jgi:hypothetical protein
LIEYAEWLEDKAKQLRTQHSAGMKKHFPDALPAEIPPVSPNS